MGERGSAKQWRAAPCTAARPRGFVQRLGLTHRDSAKPAGNALHRGMGTTLGTPQDITLASLRVELLFAADEASATIWQKAAAEANSMS